MITLFNERLRILLASANTDGFTALPKHAGLKTAIVARDQGLVELAISTNRVTTIRLTDAGAAHLKLLDIATRR